MNLQRFISDPDGGTGGGVSLILIQWSLITDHFLCCCPHVLQSSLSSVESRVMIKKKHHCTVFSLFLVFNYYSTHIGVWLLKRAIWEHTKNCWSLLMGHSFGPITDNHPNSRSNPKYFVCDSMVSILNKKVSNFLIQYTSKF